MQSNPSTTLINNISTIFEHGVILENSHLCAPPVVEWMNVKCWRTTLNRGQNIWIIKTNSKSIIIYSQKWQI